MTMETQIRTDRARIHESVRDIYTKLTEGGNVEEAPFYSLKDVFMVAACLGYNKGNHKSFPPGKIASTIRAEVFKEKELDILKAIALAHTNEIRVLEKGHDEIVSSQVLTIAEEYAHGGIEEVNNLIVEKPGYSLMNLVDLIESDLY